MRRWRFSLFILFFICSFEPISSFALCVNSSEANLRASPSSKAEITWTVGRYTPLIKLEKKGSWYKVEDQDGDEHWVPVSQVTSQYQCVSVKTKSAHLRSGPGSQHPLAVYGNVDKYWPLKRLDRQEDWLRVEDDMGNSFWVHESNVWRPVTVSHIGF